jgi:superfamily II RNA helicase
LSDARAAFLSSRPYALDPFQSQALGVIDEGRSVLVSAPTGSGKTVVAEYAVHLALQRGTRVFYTTPLKALSNQKYSDLSAAHGGRNVGLLTGDNSINGGARVVVMTTEVLRNMIYEDPAGLAGLSHVVLDEVHYLEDRYRGAVWEEVILHLPRSVQLVCLSATVSNAVQLAAWIGSVRGSTGAVIEQHRPIELRHLFAVGERGSDAVHLLPTFARGRPNRDAVTLERAGAFRGGGSPRARGWLRTPRRVDLLEQMAADSLLPAIYFLFSRARCDEAVRHCLDAGFRVTDPSERRRIREIAEAHVEALSDEDLSVLGYGQMLAGLEAGVAAHHAGLVPPFKEMVEACFSEALVKVVFATETLALGINMPARSVVIEQLSKWNGDSHVPLTAGEYTQLTGRAGRRGIDQLGYALALWSPFHSFAEVADLASSESAALTSSFRPTYNMAVNLIRRYRRADAYRLVDSSFAQYLSDASLARQLDAVLALLAGRGYVRGWATTAAGDTLARLYHEADLLVTEVLSAGILDGLDPPSLAALVSTFTFESRRDGPPAGTLPTAALAGRFGSVEELAEALRAEEEMADLPVTRPLDTGFAGLAYAWTRGGDLRALLSGRGPGGGQRSRSADRVPRSRGRGARSAQDPAAAQVMTGGDFVRSVRQLVDLLRQISVAAGSRDVSSVAAAAADLLVRGVVAASAVVQAPAPPSGAVRARERPAEAAAAGAAVARASIPPGSLPSP